LDASNIFCKWNRSFRNNGCPTLADVILSEAEESASCSFLRLGWDTQGKRIFLIPVTENYLPSAHNQSMNHDDRRGPLLTTENCQLTTERHPTPTPPTPEKYFQTMQIIARLEKKMRPGM
jgi:hypothetical protein